MNKQETNTVRRDSHIDHAHDISNILSWNIIGEEVVVFVCGATAVQLEVASTRRLSKVAQLRITSPSNCNQTELFYYGKAVDVLSLDVLPLCLP